MARYIDADKVMEEINLIGGHNLCEWETLGVKALIDRQPAADVVPKSEVDELQCKYELAVAEREANVKGFTEALAKAKSDVAREIFEEIQKIFVHRIVHNESQYFEGVLDNITKDLAELKKKYAEDEK